MNWKFRTILVVHRKFEFSAGNIWHCAIIARVRRKLEFSAWNIEFSKAWKCARESRFVKFIFNDYIVKLSYIKCHIFFRFQKSTNCAREARFVKFIFNDCITPCWRSIYVKWRLVWLKVSVLLLSCNSFKTFYFSFFIQNEKISRLISLRGCDLFTTN